MRSRRRAPRFLLGGVPSSAANLRIDRVLPKPILERCNEADQLRLFLGLLQAAAELLITPECLEGLRSSLSGTISSDLTAFEWRLDVIVACSTAAPHMVILVERRSAGIKDAERAATAILPFALSIPACIC